MDTNIKQAGRPAKLPSFLAVELLSFAL